MHDAVEEITVEHGYWLSLALADNHHIRKYRYDNDHTYFCLEKQEHNVLLIRIPNDVITSKEADLIDLAISVYTNAHSVADTEEVLLELGAWLHQQVELGKLNESIPKQLLQGLGMKDYHMEMGFIPFLLTMTEENDFAATYTELKKILTSFFEVDVIVIPLKRGKSLILAPKTTLHHVEEKEIESLTSLCFALHEMITMDWMEDCMLTVGEAIYKEEEILKTLNQLQKTMEVGVSFYKKKSIFFSWELALEEIVWHMNESDFLFSDHLHQLNHVDSDLFYTMEKFFECNCHVGETANALFIHRNTLLYRLEKFKNETELDPRQFNDSVFIKLMMLMHKLAKN